MAAPSQGESYLYLPFGGHHQNDVLVKKGQQVTQRSLRVQSRLESELINSIYPAITTLGLGRKQRTEQTEMPWVPTLKN